MRSVLQVVYALGEMALMYPISGGFYAYSSRFIDQNIGFAMGLNYAMQWLIVSHPGFPGASMSFLGQFCAHTLLFLL